MALSNIEDNFQVFIAIHKTFVISTKVESKVKSSQVNNLNPARPHWVFFHFPVQLFSRTLRCSCLKMVNGKLSLGHFCLVTMNFKCTLKGSKFSLRLSYIVQEYLNSASVLPTSTQFPVDCPWVWDILQVSRDPQVLREELPLETPALQRPTPCLVCPI